MTGDRPDDRPRSPRGSWPIVALGLVLVLAAGLRLIDLGGIDRLHFDEKYYVVQAQERIDELEPVDRPAHPPLGTWLIAVGITVAGDDPFGWRLVPAVGGVASVALAHLLATRVWGRRWVGVAAAFFVAVDVMAVTTSRIGILDGLQPPFALGAVLCALRWRPGEGGRRWLVAAGACAGAMTAIKWNGALLVAALAAWAAVRAVLAARVRRNGLQPVLASAVLAVGLLGGAAATVYVASYATWFADYPDTQTAADRCEDDGDCGTGAVDRVRGWWWEQFERIDFHQRLEATHPDRSHAVEWPLLNDPVTMFLERCTADDVAAGGCERTGTRRIMAVGNPAVWWPGFLSLPVALWLAVRRRRPGIALATLAPLALWLPWVGSPKPGFIYFMTPVVPFLAVALAGVIGTVPSTRARRALTAAVVAAVVALAVWLAPFTFGWALDPQGIADRSLLPGWPDP